MVIDALDECVDAPLLFRALSNHSLQKSAGLFVSGRIQVAQLCETLKEVRRVDIGIAETSKDIELFLQTRCEGAFKPLHRQKTINAVLAKAEGMFLWISLVVQALESLYDTSDIDTAIASLPDDLYAAYDTTLRRMAANMKNQVGKQKLCRNVLQWLACSERAMSVRELFTALSIGVKPEDILFTEEDVISACRPLVVVQQDTIQLVHFSTKEYLTGDYLANSVNLRHFYVDLRQTNLAIAQACTGYIRSAKVEKLFPVKRNSDENRLKSSGIDTSSLAPEALKDAWRDLVNAELPFAEYAVLYWLPHLQVSTYGMDAQNEDSSISVFLKSHCTLVWIELYFTINFQPSDLEKLSADIVDCFNSMEGMPSSLEMAWKRAVHAILHKFGLALLRSPNEVRHLDPTILEQYNAELLKWQNWSEACYEKHMVLRFDSAGSWPMPSKMTDTDPKQHLYFRPGRSDKGALGFLHFHRQSKSLLFADKHLDPGTCAWLYCQNTESGVRSKPLLVSNPSTTARKLAAAGTDKDSKLLCLHYIPWNPFKGKTSSKTSSMIVLHINLRDDSTIPRWATLLFTISIDDNWPQWNKSLQVTSEYIYLGGRTYCLKDGECVQDTEYACDGNSAGPLFYYANGAMLFQTYPPITADAEDTAKEGRMSYFNNYRGSRMTLSPSQTIIGVSHDGRYVLVRKVTKSCGSKRWLSDFSDCDIDIFDTLLNHYYHLLENKMPAVKRAEYAFYGGDEWLIYCIDVRIHRYHLPSLVSGSNQSRTISIPDEYGFHWWSNCINEDEQEAFVVLGRKWYRLDLSGLKWKDEPAGENRIRPYYAQVSADGRRLAVIEPTDRTSRILMFDLQSGLLDREYNPGLLLLPADHEKLLASPDLMIWRVCDPGPEYLCHLDDGHAHSTVKAFHIPESVHSLGKDRVGSDCFGMCGKYFAFSHRSSSNKTSESETHDMNMEVTTLELDPVHSNVKSHSRQSMPLPSNSSSFVEMKFHPNSPMLAILCMARGLAKLYLHDLATLETFVAWTTESREVWSEPLRHWDSEQSTFFDLLSH